MIARAVVLGVERELDLLGGRAAHIETGTFEVEAVRGVAAIRHIGDGARPHTGSKADRGQRGWRLRTKGRRGQETEAREERGRPMSRNGCGVITDNFSEHD